MPRRIRVSTIPHDPLFAVYVHADEGQFLRNMKIELPCARTYHHYLEPHAWPNMKTV